MSAEENFRLYLRLSEELLKFISQAEPDIDEFLDLVAQRGRLIDRMKQDPETEPFRQTEACRALVAKIKPLDMQIGYKARAWLNKSRRRTASVHAYDLRGIQPAGRIFNKKY